MIIEKAKIAEGGRIVIPARFRKALGLDRGSTVSLELDGDHITIRPARAALRRIQRGLEPFRPEQRSAAEELLADRRIGEARER